MKQSITKGYGLSGVSINLNIQEILEIQHIAAEWKELVRKAKENKQFEKIELSFPSVYNVTNLLENILTNTEVTEPSAFLEHTDFIRQQEERNK